MWGGVHSNFIFQTVGSPDWSVSWEDEKQGRVEKSEESSKSLKAQAELQAERL